MPSPTWSTPATTPVYQALAAAQHEAWRITPERRRAVFTAVMQRLLGEEHADAILLSALAIFDAQPSAPAGYQDPPANMHFECCPRCQRLSGKKYSQAPNGRVKLNALRDRDWLERQFAVGRTRGGIAKELGCSEATVTNWTMAHGLSRRPMKAHDEDVAAAHDAGLAPGEIARKLDLEVSLVRDALKRTRGVTLKSGHHYFAKEWWVQRIVTRQMTTTECARDAGIAKHACAYYLKRFGLQEITKARTTRKGQRRFSHKYPELADPARLRALMDKHGSYEQVALAVCGSRNSATNVRNWWLTHFGAPPAKKKRGGQITPWSAPAWWDERLAKGMTTWAMAEEIEVDEKTVREKLRVLGGDYLARGYRNNTAAEKAKRAPQAKPWWAKPDAPAAGAA